MKKKIAILGSTGSIGKTTVEIIKKEIFFFEVVLLTTNNNLKEITKQIRELKPRNLVINNINHYLKLKKKYKRINIFANFDFFFKKFNKKIDYTISAISGLSGLQPTLDIIKYTKNETTNICRNTNYNNQNKIMHIARYVHSKKKC